MATPDLAQQVRDCLALHGIARDGDDLAVEGSNLAPGTVLVIDPRHGAASLLSAARTVLGNHGFATEDDDTSPGTFRVTAGPAPTT